MLKYIFLLILPIFIFGDEASVVEPEEAVKVKDTSGKSADEIREIAEKIDEKSDKKNVNLQDVFDAVDDKGKIDIEKLQKPWEHLSPQTAGYDWIQTKSGEWFKGEIIAMYDDNLEFDSDEIGLYEFDFDDITQIKTHNMLSVNIEHVATFDGLLRFKDNKMTIIQGDTKYVFPRNQVVSLGPTSEKEKNLWSVKISLSADIRSGNKDESDYAARINLKRRTDKTRLRLDYLGRISEVNDEKTADDHRINEKFDVYLTRKFFWTPVFSEYYRDTFQNINSQITIGAGLGYTLVDTKKVEWDISAGPAVIQTKYVTVEDTQDTTVRSPALEISTKLNIDLSKRTDFKWDYKMSLTDKRSGRYKHHMITTLENELTSWMDLDITFIWDHINSPEQESDGTLPKHDDYQLLIGFGVEF
jgi:putative salt-induced outer membrane protein YdiY